MALTCPNGRGGGSTSDLADPIGAMAESTNDLAFLAIGAYRKAIAKRANVDPDAPHIHSK